MTINSQVEDQWEGWDGDTIVKLMDGSVWKQVEYHYEYLYAYMPTVKIVDNVMHVAGMSRGVRVGQISPIESHIVAEWEGWDGETTVELDNGSVWKQAEYHYEYQYQYRPEVMIDGDRMYVKGMSKPVRVERVS